MLSIGKIKIKQTIPPQTSRSQPSPYPSCEGTGSLFKGNVRAMVLNWLTEESSGELL